MSANPFVVVAIDVDVATLAAAVLRAENWQNGRVDDADVNVKIVALAAGAAPVVTNNAPAKSVEPVAKVAVPVVPIPDEVATVGTPKP